MAFEIRGIPSYGSGCLEFFKKHGFKMEKLPLAQNTRMKDLWMSMRRFGQKDLFILTPGHAMSCRDGILIDTMRETWNYRKVEHAWIVTR